MAKLLNVGLVLIGGSLGHAAVVAAQEIGFGPTYGFTSRSYLVEGPGLQAWASFDVLSVLRLQASVAREWGRETEHRSFCSYTGPEGGGPDDCVMEDVRSFTTITTAEFSALFITPQRLRTRIGLGASYGSHRFEVGQEGLETGRIQTPIEGRERKLGEPGWLLLVEHSLPGIPASLRATYNGYKADFGPCIWMDTWSLCGQESFGRFTLGVGYLGF